MLAHAVRKNRAFTLVELIVIIVVLAILSGVAIPKYIDYTANAKASAAKATLGAVRSTIANYYANSALSGAATFPTAANLNALGTVMQETIPANPYLATASNLVVQVTWNATPPTSGTNGYNYDNAVGRFWLNTATVGENLW